jgi:hypothetical protein
MGADPGAPAGIFAASEEEGDDEVCESMVMMGWGRSVRRNWVSVVSGSLLVFREWLADRRRDE